jgi:hypothetical protein
VFASSRMLSAESYSRTAASKDSIRTLKGDMKATALRTAISPPSILVVLALAITLLPAHSQNSAAESKSAVPDLAVIVPSM